MAMIQRQKCTTRNFSLPERLDEQLVERAQVEDRPVSRLICRALEKYLAASDERANGQEMQR